MEEKSDSDNSNEDEKELKSADIKESTTADKVIEAFMAIRNSQHSLVWFQGTDGNLSVSQEENKKKSPDSDDTSDTSVNDSEDEKKKTKSEVKAEKAAGKSKADKVSTKLEGN